MGRFIQLLKSFLSCISHVNCRMEKMTVQFVLSLLGLWVCLQLCQGFCLTPHRHSHSSHITMIATTKKVRSVQSRALEYPINFFYPGLRQIHVNPAVYEVDDFISKNDCDQLISIFMQNDEFIMNSGVPVLQVDKSRLLLLVPIVLMTGMLQYFLALGSENVDAMNIALTTVINSSAFVISLIGCIQYALQKFPSIGKSSRTSTMIPLHRDSIYKSNSTDGTQHASNYVIRRLIKNAESLINTSVDTFERPTLTEYKPGQQFTKHHDASSDIHTDGWHQLGGQRLVTLIIYLNDVNKGGRTIFDSLNLQIVPKRGKALLFFPADCNGLLDPMTDHRGEEAVENKYIIQVRRGLVNKMFFTGHAELIKIHLYRFGSDNTKSHILLAGRYVFLCIGVPS